MDRLKQREAAINRYLNGALEFCDNHELCQQVTEIRLLMNYLFLAGRFFEPKHSLADLLSGNVSSEIHEKLYCDLKPNLLICPFDPQDSVFGLAWKKLTQSPHQVQYAPAPHLITLRMDFDETPRVLGITLLHELSHAYRAYAEGRAGKPKEMTHEQEMAEEHVVYLFEGRIMRALNKEAYDEAIRRWCTYLQRKVTRQWFKKPRLLAVPQQHTLLDQILGPIDNESHRNARHNNFLLHAHFAFVQQSNLSEQNKKQIQLKIVGSLYQ